MPAHRSFCKGSAVCGGSWEGPPTAAQSGDPRRRGALVRCLQAPVPGQALASSRPRLPARLGRDCSRTRQDVRRASGDAPGLRAAARVQGLRPERPRGPRRGFGPPPRAPAFPPSARSDLSPRSAPARPRRRLLPERAPRARAPGPRERAPPASYLRALLPPPPPRPSGSGQRGRGAEPAPDPLASPRPPRGGRALGPGRGRGRRASGSVC